MSPAAPSAMPVAPVPSSRSVNEADAKAPDTSSEAGPARLVAMIVLTEFNVAVVSIHRPPPEALPLVPAAPGEPGVNPKPGVPPGPGLPPEATLEATVDWRKVITPRDDPIPPPMASPPSPPAPPSEPATIGIAPGSTCKPPCPPAPPDPAEATLSAIVELTTRLVPM